MSDSDYKGIWDNSSDDEDYEPTIFEKRLFEIKKEYIILFCSEDFNKKYNIKITDTTLDDIWTIQKFYFDIANIDSDKWITDKYEEKFDDKLLNPNEDKEIYEEEASMCY